MVVEWVTLLMRKQVEGKESMRSHHRWCENGEEWRDSALIAIYGPGCLLLMAVGHLTVTQMISSLLIVGRVHSSQCALSCMLEPSRSGGTNSLVTWPSMLSLWGEHWGLPTTVALFFITLSVFPGEISKLLTFWWPLIKHPSSRVLCLHLTFKLLLMTWIKYTY